MVQIASAVPVYLVKRVIFLFSQPRLCGFNTNNVAVCFHPGNHSCDPYEGLHDY